MDIPQLQVPIKLMVFFNYNSLKQVQPLKLIQPTKNAISKYFPNQAQDPHQAIRKPLISKQLFPNSLMEVVLIS